MFVGKIVAALVLVWTGLLGVEGNFQLNDFVESSIRKQPEKVRYYSTGGYMCLFIMIKKVSSAGNDIGLEANGRKTVPFIWEAKAYHDCD